MKDHLRIEVEQTEDVNLVSIVFTPVAVEPDGNTFADDARDEY